jgi:hypothetical protein
LNFRPIRLRRPRADLEQIFGDDLAMTDDSSSTLTHHDLLDAFLMCSSLLLALQQL